MTRGPLLIVGASGRAAAASARRAGFDPFVIDLFADADTRRLAPTLRCPLDQYPGALPALARQAPPGPFLYTGGLENHPDIVAALSAERELWGNGPDVLAHVRDPFSVHELLRAPGSVPPPLYTGSERRGSSPPCLPDGGDKPRRSPEGSRWLRKPLAGSGGLGVRFATTADLRRAGDRTAGFYVQRFVPGRPVSVVLHASDRPGVVGVSRQLVGEPWLHARPFQYAGNVAGVAGDAWVAAAVVPAVSRLAAAVPLAGLLGIDLIAAGGVLYPLEVNPRYTASVEVLEYAGGFAALAGESRPPARVVGKAVYYTPRRLTVPASGPWDESLARCTDVWRRPDFADIPDPGTVAEPGQPVLTVLADAETEAGCLARLKSRAAELDQLFGYTSTGGADS